MPLNPKRGFNTVVEGQLGLNDDQMWALFEGEEELTYWDEGQEMEILRQGAWTKGTVAWDGEGYALSLHNGELLPLTPGDLARRRVGGSI